ncbi:hypothetical protein D4Q80_02785 [bacterium]|nr:MAG: hypothetical protein D4Q80_02785 [bacterium]
MTRSNKALVERLVRVIQETGAAKQKIRVINKDRQALETKIKDLQSRIAEASQEKEALDAQLKSEGQGGAQKIEELSVLLGKLAADKSSLQQELAALKHKEDIAAEELRRLDQNKLTLEKANLDKMYRWLETHQNPRTGLVMSFEGDSDIAGWAFTYDQALLIQVYANFEDAERSRKILDFFSKRAERAGRQFLNAYYVNDGSPAEFSVHSGPNIWLGVAIVQYTRKTGDRSYLHLAEEIASSVIALQNEDKDAGIRGGPQISWYSTEHNLDAYAFFNMLYKITAKERYAQARNKVLNWLLKHTYDKTDIPVKRGKGDSTIATDTYAWSIAAIGPEKLAELGMDPDKIIEFAEQNCAAEVSYLRPEGQSVKIKGFDFASQRHASRGGVVSSEWTAQMVISFKIMADFYRRKNMDAQADIYSQKAREYLAQLGKMIISSPSPSGQGESCLPYATQDFVDTGHGWMTPKGKATGSVAGTAYAIFAYYDYNPLGLGE